MVLKTAHQVGAYLLLPCAAEICSRSASIPPKNSHGILPRLRPSTLPAASRELRSAPGQNSGTDTVVARDGRISTVDASEHLARHEKTL
jgi:hypothetical protein